MLLLLLVFSAFAGQQPTTPLVSPPAIATLLKPRLLERAVAEREILTHADLDDGKRYEFYTVMLVRAGAARTRQVLTDYKLYAEMVPYIEKAEFNAATKTLDLEGGIWKFHLQSSVQFEEKAEQWIRYRVIGGHFRGLEGDILFEPRGEKGTLVMMRGAQTGTEWPPALVIEQGAQIVFGFTAKRMRSYLEKK